MTVSFVIPGATITASFALPVDAAMIQALTLDYSQGNKVLFTKTKDDCELTGKKGTVKLTQEDTLKFANNTMTRVQIGLLTEGGETIFSYSTSFMTGVRENRVVL